MTRNFYVAWEVKFSEKDSETLAGQTYGLICAYRSRREMEEVLSRPNETEYVVRYKGTSLNRAKMSIKDLENASSMLNEMLFGFATRRQSDIN